MIHLTMIWIKLKCGFKGFTGLKAWIDYFAHPAKSCIRKFEFLFSPPVASKLTLGTFLYY